MPTAYTSLLGLALPVTGELSGTWGDTVNNSITSLLDTAIAGTTTLSTDADVTLTTTTGASNQARQAILLCNGARTAARNITAPATSKTYVVINSTTGGFGVVIRGAGPTTGVTIANGERAVVAWNGSDFVKISGFGGTLTVTDLTVTGNTILGDAAGDTITVNGATTFTNVNPTLSAGTANGVLYLNGSKVATSGSALTFDGTIFNAPTLTTSATATFGANVYLGANALYYYAKTSGGSNIRMLGINAGNSAYVGPIDSGPVESIVNASSSSTNIQFYASGSEAMRLTSTGLGIGTSSPGYKLQVAGAGTVAEIVASNTAGTERIHLLSRNSAGVSYVQSQNSQLLVGTFDNYAMQFMTNNTSRMLLDTSGNLGIGTSSPVAKLTVNGNQALIGGGGTTIPALSTALVLNEITSNAAATGQSDYGFLRLSAGGGTSLGFKTAIDLQGYGTTDNSQIRFYTSGTQRAVIDSSGNLGLGVTPSAAWFASSRAMQIGSAAAPYLALFQQTTTTSDGYMAWGVRLSGDRTFAYQTTGDAVTAYRQNSGVHAWFTAPSGTAGNTISFTQAMTLDASGYLGVGLTSPVGRVTIKGAAGSSALQQLGFQYQGSSSYFMALGLDSASGDAQIMSGSGAALIFYTNSDLVSTNERARIDSSGNLLLGTTGSLVSAVSRFRVSASSAPAVDAKTTAAADAVVDEWNAATSGDNTFERFWTEGTATQRGSIDYNRAGGLVRYNTTSDYRAKDILGPVQNPGAVIDALKVYEGRMKGATQTRPMLVAHEAQEVTPYAVSGIKDEVNPDGTPKFQQIDVSSLVPLLLAEMQSLRARVAQLERQP